MWIINTGCNAVQGKNFPSLCRKNDRGDRMTASIVFLIFSFNPEKSLLKSPQICTIQPMSSATTPVCIP